MARSAGRITGQTDRAQPPPGPDLLASHYRGGSTQVGVLVDPSLPLTFESDEVSVQVRVVCLLEDPPRPDGDQRTAACRRDIEALMGATTDPGCPETTDIAAAAVLGVNRETVAVEANPPDVAHLSSHWSGEYPVVAGRSE